MIYASIKMKYQHVIDVNINEYDITANGNAYQK